MDGGDCTGLHMTCELSMTGPSSDPNFDRVTRLAATIFGLPYAVLFLAGSHGAELKSTFGFGDLPDGPVVPSSDVEPRLSGLGRLTDDLGLHFQASAPMAGEAGAVLGWLCVMGSEPRPGFDATETRILQGLADMAVELVEMRREQLALLERSREIAHLAHHDPLTELGNRRHLDKALSHTIKGLRPHEQLVLYCVDLDGFKRVNDSLGHGAGDLLLRDVTMRLRSAIRPSDTIARIGGDEFAIVQSGVRAVAESTRFANSIISAVSKPYGLNGHSVRIGTSIGAAVGRFPSPSPEQLLFEADRALYRAKETGRGRFAMFDGARAGAAAPRFVLSRLRFDPPAPRPVRVHP